MSVVYFWADVEGKICFADFEGACVVRMPKRACYFFLLLVLLSCSQHDKSSIIWILSRRSKQICSRCCICPIEKTGNWTVHFNVLNFFTCIAYLAIAKVWKYSQNFTTIHFLHISLLFQRISDWIFEVCQILMTYCLLFVPTFCISLERIFQWGLLTFCWWCFFL